jgi:hypothetical protein
LVCACAATGLSPSIEIRKASLPSEFLIISEVSFADGVAQESDTSPS